MRNYDDPYSFDEKPKRKRDQDPTTWADAWKAIGILVGAAFSVGIIFSFLQTIVLGDKLGTYYDILVNASGAQTDIFDSNFMGAYVNALSNPILVVGIALISIVLVVLALFMVYGLIHVFATKMLGGDGTLRGLIVRSNTWTTGVYVAYSIAVGLGSFLTISSTVERFEGINIAASSQKIAEYNNFLISQSWVTYGAVLIAWLVWGIAVSFVTARNYHIGKGKGCIAMILTNVVLIAAYCACIFAIGASLLGMIATV